jgi:signal transduction histidine kinase
MNESDSLKRGSDSSVSEHSHDGGADGHENNKVTIIVNPDRTPAHIVHHGGDGHDGNDGGGATGGSKAQDGHDQHHRRDSNDILRHDCHNGTESFIFRRNQNTSISDCRDGNHDGHHREEAGSYMNSGNLDGSKSKPSSPRGLDPGMEYHNGDGYHGVIEHDGAGERPIELDPILNATTDGVLILDASGYVRVSNAAARRLLRMPDNAPQDWLFGCPVVVGTKTEIQIMNGGSFRIIEMNVTESQWKKQPAFVACLRDINAELEKLNYDLAMARDEAIAASRLKSQFVANVSHEIRTPMSGIIGMSELLASEESLAPELREYANHIYGSSKRLFGVLNQLLDFSKLEAGRFLISDATFSPESIAQEVMQNISPAAEKKNLRLTLKVGQNVPDTVLGDETKVRQALLNLAHNAVKFTMKGEVKLLIESMSSPPNRIGLQFIVSDTGIGINKKHMPLLFQPFVQVDGTSSRSYEGTGLGLSISKRFVELLGGTITVDSELDKGSTFTISLFFKESDGRLEPPNETAPEPT